MLRTPKGSDQVKGLTHILYVYQLSLANRKKEQALVRSTDVVKILTQCYIYYMVDEDGMVEMLARSRCAHASRISIDRFISLVIILVNTPTSESATKCFQEFFIEQPRTDTA